MAGLVCEYAASAAQAVMSSFASLSRAEGHFGHTRAPSARHAGASSGRNAGASSEAMLAEPSRDEHRQDETSRDEQGVAPMTAVIDYIETRTGRPWGYRPGSQPWEALVHDVRDFGADRVVEAMESAGLEVAHPDAAQLIYGAARILHPIGNGKVKPAGGHTRTAQEVEDAFNR